MAGDDKEQQLREKIASQKAAIDALPSLSSIVYETGITSPETKARAQLIKELSDNEEQLELLIESKRVAAVVRLQDELHPPESEDCPICLETIKHVNSETVVRFYCCGGFTCTKCGKERIDNSEIEGFDKMFRDKCPLCREKMSGEFKKMRTKILEHANKGRAWAQFHIGRWYSNETGKEIGIPIDKEKGLHFLKQAADQRDSDAFLEMAKMSFTSPERDETKRMYYLKEAADLGNQIAQVLLADAFNRQKDDKGRLHYITLAASQGDPNALSNLGYLFMKGECGLARSLILAKHYNGKSLKDTEKLAEIQCQHFAYVFSTVLFDLSCDQYEGFLGIPGHSPIPEVLFWARRALEVEGNSLQEQETSNVIDLISEIENKTKNHCANCRKEAGCSSLMRCSRCLGAWYCGKECQVQHWKAGHKIDCFIFIRK
mmetsp:Transcript_28046/g.40098  ORF Transcript_28046/g.40098 Transcript_28046/m.40098 type:complete len:431 (+) Transcript_28046:88-1380(+)